MGAAYVKPEFMGSNEGTTNGWSSGTSTTTSGTGSGFFALDFFAFFAFFLLPARMLPQMRHTGKSTKGHNHKCQTIPEEPDVAEPELTEPKGSKDDDPDDKDFTELNQL